MKCLKTYIALLHCLVVKYCAKNTKPSCSNMLPFVFDLQLFTGEKTEDATPKRKEEAKQKGQVAKSMEINSAFVILISFYGLKVFGGYIYDELVLYMQFIFSHFSTADFSLQTIQMMFIDFTIILAKTTLPIMLLILAISIGINYLQIGFIFSTQILMPDLSKIDPISGFQRMFSLRSLVELVKSFFKIFVISFFIYRFILKQAPVLPKLLSADLYDSLAVTSALILDLGFQIGGVLLVLGAMDYFYQWWQTNDSLKMSKQEVKDEHKQQEGDPQIKSKIRERQRAMAMKRMMSEVPKSSVVVTNPTHYAVALKYDKDMQAPLVLAKGQDFVAEKIKQIAREHNIVIVENKMLARTLYATVDIGQMIPAEFYQAVAELLAYVYRLKKKLS